MPPLLRRGIRGVFYRNPLYEVSASLSCACTHMAHTKSPFELLTKGERNVRVTNNSWMMYSDRAILVHVIVYLSNAEILPI